MQGFNESGWDWFLSDTHLSDKAPSNALTALAPISSAQPTIGLLGNILGANALLQSRPNYLETWAAANFSDELQKPYWTRDELVAVLLGVNPIFASFQDLAANKFKDDTAWEGMRLHEIVHRAIRIGELTVQSRPCEAIDWALQQYIPVPPELLAIAAQRNLPMLNYPNELDTVVKKHEEQTRQLHVEIAELKEMAQSRADLVDCTRNLLSQQSAIIDDLNCQLAETTALAEKQRQTATLTDKVPQSGSATTRCYRTVAKLFFVLVAKHYGFSCSGTKWNRTKLEADLAEYNIRVDDETLRKHLRAGGEELSR